MKYLIVGVPDDQADAPTSVTFSTFLDASIQRAICNSETGPGRDGEGIIRGAVGLANKMLAYPPAVLDTTHTLVAGLLENGAL